MKTSRVKEYYQYYMHAVNYYGHRKVSNCYKNPSQRKKYAEERIAMEAYENRGYGYTVISYNTSIFTCGYLYQRNGNTYFVIHTPTDRGVMLIEED